MINANLLILNGEDFKFGQLHFSNYMKSVVQYMDKELYNLLDKSNTDIFLSPLLFALLNSKKSEITLRQILVGFTKTTKKSLRIIVRSNKYGQIYLPNIGTLKINIPKKATYVLEKTEKSFLLYKNKMLIDFKIVPELKIKNTNIIYQLHTASIIEPYVNIDISVSRKLKHSLISQRHFDTINAATSILKEHFPDFFIYFKQSVKWVFPFENTKKNSFSTPGVLGVNFLNTYKQGSLAFFIEDIVHQSGHVIFSTISYNPKEYFLVNPYTPLKEFIPSKKDETIEDRTLYSAFHGIFTASLMCNTFSILLNRNILNGENKHELCGRFSYILIRFILDMESLRNITNLFSKKGENLFNHLYTFMLSCYKSHGILVNKYRLNNQLYNFDYKKFIKLNPYSNTLNLIENKVKVDNSPLPQIVYSETVTKRGRLHLD